MQSHAYLRLSFECIQGMLSFGTEAGKAGDGDLVLFLDGILASLMIVRPWTSFLTSLPRSFQSRKYQSEPVAQVV